jgi:hypothetical protein
LFHRYILVVWNIKSQQQRWVTIIPSDSWGGAGLLGVTIRLDNYAQAEERLIHVLQVEHHSPAQVAGLVEYQDYLLGTTTETLDGTETLSKILQAHTDKVVELYVYNVESDMVRVVALMPTWSWGGKGLLGAQVATGYLHRLPSSTQETIGSSLERKVRWVGLAGSAAQSSQPSSSSTTTSSTTATTTTTGSTVSIPTFEMEPQLEMEPADVPTQDVDQRQESAASKMPITNHKNNTNHQNGSTSTSMAETGVAVVVEQQRYDTTSPPHAFARKEKAASEPFSMATTQMLISADTAAAAAAVTAATTITASPSSAPAATAAATAASSTLAEELFMGPPPVTPPNERTAKRIQQPVKDPSIHVFVPPPMLSSPYWSQVASKKVQHHPISTNRSRATSSDSFDLR